MKKNNQHKSIGLNGVRVAFFILFLLATSFVSAQEKVEISGFSRTYEGVLFDSTGNFAIVQQTLNLNFEKRGEKVAFKANPMLYLYGSDSLNFRLREIYADLYFDNFDLRLGKQQIVWGKADGVFITDIVSPLNLTEFLLPDFDEIRTGVIAAKFDYYIGNSTLEAIWIPQFTPTTKPSSGSIWNITPKFPAPVTFDLTRSEIDPSLENSEFFLKFSTITSNIDFDIMGGYTWDDNPAMYVQRHFEMDMTQSPPQPVLVGLTVSPQHHRLWVTGGAFSTEINGIIFRGEGAYYQGKYFQTEDITDSDALVRKNYLNYVLGIDFNLGDVKMSGQFIQKYILDHDPLMAEDAVNNTATILARYDTMREMLHLELFSYIGLSGNDALIRPKITYDFDDSFSILLGANVFVGDRNGQFGQFKDNSMIYTKIKYSF